MAATGATLSIREAQPSTQPEFRAPGGFRLFRVVLRGVTSADRWISTSGTSGLARCHRVSSTAATLTSECWVLPASPDGAFTFTAAGVASGRRVARGSIRVRNLVPAPGQVSSDAARTALQCGARDGRVRLTFDDGYISYAGARSLVSILDRNHIRARFFFVGSWARSASGAAVVKLIRSHHHLVENHTDRHRALTTLSTTGIRAQISRGVRPSGVPRLVRPPYGDGWNDARVATLTRSLGYHVCYWSVDTRDWEGASPSTMARRVRYGDSATPPVFPNGVILMHMNHFTSAKLTAVIAAVRARGLRFATA